mgnify:CR=1 FL=1|tara:strand:+ start:6171 stop:6488 length:318 start_codon:yes stop_codon:yes gene_type:complete
MNNIIEVYNVNWGGASIIAKPYSDGLWDNNNNIAIHWPIFCKNYLNDENAKLKKDYLTQFYIKYGDDDEIEVMDFNYYILNDIVFNKKTWKKSKKAQIFTTIKPL